MKYLTVWDFINQRGQQVGFSDNYFEESPSRLLERLKLEREKLTRQSRASMVKLVVCLPLPTDRQWRNYWTEWDIYDKGKLVEARCKGAYQSEGVHQVIYHLKDLVEKESGYGVAKLTCCVIQEDCK